MDRNGARRIRRRGPVGAIQARLRDRVLVAPFSGVLGFRQVSTGAYVSPGQAVATLIDDTQQTVNGWVRVKLYKGGVSVVSRDSKTDSLFDPTIATFEDDAGAYNQKDAHGFIRLNALRMRIAANRAAARGGKKKA